MNIFKPVCLFVLLVLPLTLFGQQFPQDIIVQTYNAMQEYQSMSFNAVCRYKFSAGKDTTIVHEHEYLLKDPYDSIAQGALWLKKDTSYYQFYHRYRRYIVRPDKRTATVCYIHDKSALSIMGNHFLSIIAEEFLKPDKIKEYLNAGNELSLLKDTTLDGRECYRVQIKHPDKVDLSVALSENVDVICISKKDHIPGLTKECVKFEGNYQYNDLYLESYTLNDVTEAQFSPGQIPLTYKSDTVKDSWSPKLLDSNATAPVITGKRYDADSLVSDTLQYKGKITLLDFWYMHCTGCVDAIPDLEEIKEKYKGTSLQIVGINYYDNTPKNIKLLPEFLSQHPIDYPILLVAGNVTDEYGLIAWPTFYIIGPDGKVTYRTIGYSDEIGKRIDQLVK